MNTRPDPNNPGKTIPPSFGVWELPPGSSGKRFRYGNNPVRGAELALECVGPPKLIELYPNRAEAKSHAERLN